MLCLCLNASVHSNSDAEVTGALSERGYCLESMSGHKVMRLLPKVKLVTLLRIFKAKLTALGAAIVASVNTVPGSNLGLSVMLSIVWSLLQ